MNKPFIIPYFIPHYACPNRCIFCVQNTITNIKKFNFSEEIQSLEEKVEKFLKYKGKNRGKTQIAFYGGNFLGMKQEHIKGFLDISLKLFNAKKIDSIRFSTRPDTINKEILSFLKDYPVKTIEIGVQSMDDEVLVFSQRGHDSKSSYNASLLINEFGFELGVQMMVGLPEDNQEKIIESAKKIINMNPDFIRIYPLIVFKGSLLEKLFKEKKYKALSIKEAVNITKKLYILFEEKSIPVLRMGLQISEDPIYFKSQIVAGPFHESFGQLVYSSIFFDKIKEKLDKANVQDKVTFKINPVSFSNFCGLKKENIVKIKDLYNIKKVEILQDFAIKKQSFEFSFE